MQIPLIYGKSYGIFPRLTYSYLEQYTNGYIKNTKHVLISLLLELRHIASKIVDPLNPPKYVSAGDSRLAALESYGRTIADAFDTRHKLQKLLLQNKYCGIIYQYKTVTI